MNFQIRLPLDAAPDEAGKLHALQQVFAAACNALTPLAARTRIWNRVALHHMAYKALREQFPALGSQMVCNAIYSVSRICRQVYQGPGSRFNPANGAKGPLPVLRFTDNCPVYFDRHTLSFKGQQMSLFTLDGRLTFPLRLPPEQGLALRAGRLREIVLGRRADGRFELAFLLDPAMEDTESVRAVSAEEPTPGIPMTIPDYVTVEETE